MKAKYKIQNEFNIIEFEAESISVEKCLQIERIFKAKKTWKGYNLKEMSFSFMDGLKSIHIISYKQERYKPKNKAINKKQ